MSGYGHDPLLEEEAGKRKIQDERCRAEVMRLSRKCLETRIEKKFSTYLLLCIHNNSEPKFEDSDEFAANMKAKKPSEFNDLIDLSVSEAVKSVRSDKEVLPTTADSEKSIATKNTGKIVRWLQASVAALGVALATAAYALGLIDDEIFKSIIARLAN